METSSVQDQPIQTNNVRYAPLLFVALLGLAFWFLPPPTGLSLEGWHLLIIFIGTIVSVILKPMPMGAIALVSLTLTLVTRTLEYKMALSGFSSHVVWLVVFALFIAKGFTNTGLGTRIAYIFASILGKKTLGLSYGLIATDLVMAPAIPSVTGRMGGIVFPILQGISTSYESFPNSSSARKVGAFLTATSFQCTVVTCAMFMTAMAANPLLEDLTSQQQLSGVKITWGTWALAASVPGLLSLILLPLMIYWIYPPQLKDTPNTPKIARQKLKEMGPMSSKEIILALTILLLLVLWGMGKALAFKAFIPAMIGLSILVVTKVLDWKSLVKMDNTWETMLWFSVLLMMASSLSQLGVIAWFSNLIDSKFDNVDWKVSFPILLLVYFYSHYFFASCTAHVASMYIPFLLLTISLGTPPMLAALLLIFSSNLFGGLTHYSLAPAPIMFGSGYVDIKTWWKIGFLASVLNLAIWSVVGSVWWKVLGFW